MMKASTNIRYIDKSLVVIVSLLACIGVVMMGSASIDYSAEKYGDPFFHINRQLIYMVIAIVAAAITFLVPVRRWYQMGGVCLLIGIVLLILVLIPHIGKEVKGSSRWISLGPINLQSSELAKLCVLVYMAGYLVRRQDEVRERWRGFLKPVAVLCLLVVLLLMEPDFGSAVVMMIACMGMIFLGGVGVTQFFVLVVSSFCAAFLMVYTSEYRMKRLEGFFDPWADPFGDSYQLTQSLIAFGRGEWFGLGLGNSIQKLLYLPEAHTDFVFAILAEELGFVGSIFTITLFALLIAKILQIGKKAEINKKLFSAYLSYGIALVIASQVFINVGVNTGVLPTKGLTLPFFSYGGSSLIVVFIMMGMLARIDSEINCKHAVSIKQNERARRAI